MFVFSDLSVFLFVLKLRHEKFKIGDILLFLPNYMDKKQLELILKVILYREIIHINKAKKTKSWLLSFS